MTEDMRVLIDTIVEEKIQTFLKEFKSRLPDMVKELVDLALPKKKAEQPVQTSAIKKETKTNVK